MNRYRRILLVALTAMFVTSASVAVTAQGPPPPPPPRGYPPPPPPDYPASPRGYPPPRVVDTAPPPLSPAMRVIYAPFYLAGLVLHDAFYYLVVAPFEVFGRARAYGIEGGVDRGRH